MNESFGIYRDLLRKFVAHEMTVAQFQSTFFTQFLKDPCKFDESLFLLLDELFGDVDSYTDDPVLLAKSPDFYLDLPGLERKAQDIGARLEAWRAEHTSRDDLLSGNQIIAPGRRTVK
ncbi:colicin immunity domain-containing protein [Janthinobacterium sp. HH01]|uniref:colicin immunity domain-containing protein n=1 Tax=Janthinobacterium sp. HH01 TaxID=1198452 RepID=UPI0005B993F3|nr:colicin immunity domain-containing protein [Janthinobacterium sp. HH01]